MSLGAHPQDKGVPDHLYSQLHCSHLSTTVDTIVVGKRERELDEKTILMLMDSINQTGLRQPIGVRETKDNKRVLVWGYHRLEAWRRLFNKALDENDDAGKARWHLIPSLLFKDEMTDDLAVLLEIQENLERKDLTPAEREAAMGKRAVLLEKVGGTGGQKTERGQGCSAPFRPPSLVKVAGDKKDSADYTLLNRRYKVFKTDKSAPGGGHGKAWNKQTKAEYEAFRSWLVDAEKREEAKRQKEAAAKSQTESKAFETRIKVLAFEYVKLTDNDNVSAFLSDLAEEIHSGGA